MREDIHISLTCAESHNRSHCRSSSTRATHRLIHSGCTAKNQISCWNCPGGSTKNNWLLRPRLRQSCSSPTCVGTGTLLVRKIMRAKQSSFHLPKPNYWRTSIRLFFAKMMQDQHQLWSFQRSWCQCRSSQFRLCIESSLVSISQKELVLMTFMVHWLADLLAEPLSIRQFPNNGSGTYWLALGQNTPNTLKKAIQRTFPTTGPEFSLL